MNHVEERKNATLKKKGAKPFVYTNCTDSLDKDYMKKTMELCFNKTNCNVDWTPESIFKKDVTYDPSGHCGDHAGVYIQYQCLIDLNLLNWRKT